LTESVIGAKLKVLREAASISQAKLAKQMRERGHPWQQSTVARTEGGQQPLRFEEVIELAALLNTSISELSQPDAPGTDALERPFTALLREVREAHGMTQEKFAGEMAKRCDPIWRQQTVARVEHGQRAMRLGEAIAAADILGIDLGAFAAGRPVPCRICLNCSDEPPAGYTCNTCARSGS
jgi:transcriptional regulator with XRE-family HTH domain